MGSLLFESEGAPPWMAGFFIMVGLGIVHSLTLTLTLSLRERGHIVALVLTTSAGRLV